MSNDYGFDNLEAELDRGLDGGEPVSGHGAEPAPGPFDRISDRPRDEGGRFAPAPKAKEEPAAAAPVGKPWSPLWLKDEHGVKWDTMPEPFRKALEQRERETMQGIRDHAHKAKAWEPVEQILAPYAEALRADGLSSAQYVTNLLTLDKNFRADPAATIAHLAQVAGLDLYDLADKAAGVDPQVAALQQQVADLKAKFEGGQQAGAQASQQAEIQKIADWAGAKDANGNLLRPYFNEVRLIMAKLSGVDNSLTLDQLYDQAIHAHPETRARVQADQRVSVATRARAAQQSPRSAPNGRAQPSYRLSLEEQIAAGLDEMGI